MFNPMLRSELNSTSLKGAAYCCQEAVLELEFRSGAIYRYRGVAEATYVALLAAASKGVYFNHSIRNRFPHTKIG
jgi:hypothetical protein